MDCKVEQSVIKVYLVAAASSHRRMHLSSVTRPSSVWLEEMEDNIKKSVSRAHLLEKLQDMKLASDFSGVVRIAAKK